MSENEKGNDDQGYGFNFHCEGSFNQCECEMISCNVLSHFFGKLKMINLYLAEVFMIATVRAFAG
jgi:hypothetical protein